MPTYKYIAINESGKKVNGILSSESERAARQQIKASNLTPLSLGKTNRNHFLKVRVSKKKLLFATRQIATLLDSSIPIDETLKSIALEVEDKPLSSALHSVRDEILQGSRISDAMSSHPSIFNETYRSLVAAGDAAGWETAVRCPQWHHLSPSPSSTRLAMAAAHAGSKPAGDSFRQTVSPHWDAVGVAGRLTLVSCYACGVCFSCRSALLCCSLILWAVVLLMYT